MRRKSFRKRIFTGRATQTRYLALLLLSMLVPLAAVGGCLYYLVFMLMADQLGVPEAIAINLFPVIEKINFILLVAVPPILALIVVWGVFLSHRFAGPLDRLEDELDKMVKGPDYSRRIILRKKDDLKPIADRINRLLDHVQGKHK